MPGESDELSELEEMLKRRIERLMDLNEKYKGKVTDAISKVADVTEEYVERSGKAMALMEANLERISETEPKTRESATGKFYDEYLRSADVFERDRIMKLNNIFNSLPAEIRNEMLK